MSTSSQISPAAWCKYYNLIFNTINHFVHANFMRFLISVLPMSVLLNQILPFNLVSVAQAIKKLKSSSIDCDGISAKHLNVDCPALIQHLQLLFQMCLCTSVVPESSLCRTVTLILRRGKIPTEYASYRPIAVSCNLSKIFEYFLLPSVNSLTYFGENQIGFSAGVGGQQAHHVLANFLTKDTKTGFKLHLCAFNLSKAFDTVTHSQAIFSLFTHGINI